jgi:hypothetical protein
MSLTASDRIELTNLRRFTKIRRFTTTLSEFHESAISD